MQQSMILTLILNLSMTTGHYILIQAVLDIHTRYIRFEFWGTSDNRTSKMSAIRYWGQDKCASHDLS